MKKNWIHISEKKNTMFWNKYQKDIMVECRGKRQWTWTEKGKLSNLNNRIKIEKQEPQGPLKQSPKV